MKVKLTKHFPFGNFRAISLFGVIYIKDRTGKYTEGMEKHPMLFSRTIQHERTHYKQQKELLFVLFFILYVVEWLLKLPTGHAYRNISFEREARYCQKNPDNYYVLFHYDEDGNLKSLDYKELNEKGSLVDRKHYSWTKYIFKK